jgi:hypothetical protein
MRIRALAVLVVTVLAACVGPATNFSVYEAKTVSSANSALAAVETARYTIQLAVTDRAFGPFESVAIEEAEEDVSTIEGHFASIQPPDARSDSLRQEASDLLSTATETVESARIAVRRGDLATLRQLLPQLERISNKLDRFAQQHE